MPRLVTGRNVFDEALARLCDLMGEGHRLVCAFSGGKDSTIVLELSLLAAQLTGYGPLDVVMRDDEIMYPGTFEYAERVAARDEVRFHWLVMGQPCTNVYNRESPYWWVFDERLEPSAWVREPPTWATWLRHENSIDRMVVPERFPPPPERDLFSVMGLRGSESRARLCSIFNAKGAATKPNKYGVRNFRPIYDFEDSDVWRAIAENKWDYNRCYDVFARMGIRRDKLRVAPPLMKADLLLPIAAKAWPQWFERVARRCPGARTGAQFGKLASQPVRRLGETWRECFQRVCIDEAPAWVAERARVMGAAVIKRHSNHAAHPLPDVKPCTSCSGATGSWKKLCFAMYDGDPFASKSAGIIKYVEPEFFRQGAGTWNGAPAW